MKTLFFICCLCSVFLITHMQVPSDKAINGCGLSNYDKPKEASECVQEENCCYVRFIEEDIRFCAKVPKILTSDGDYEETKKKFVTKMGSVRVENIEIKCQ